jgi:acyl-CoA synthetase (AMP-forming)/AMP-acid ligase II
MQQPTDSNKTLIAVLAQWAQQTPDKVAVRYK